MHHDMTFAGAMLFHALDSESVILSEAKKSCTDVRILSKNAALTIQPSFASASDSGPC